MIQSWLDIWWSAHGLLAPAHTPGSSVGPRDPALIAARRHSESEGGGRGEAEWRLLPRRPPPLGPPPIAGYVGHLADIVSGSTTWIGLGFSCVFVQRRDNDARISFDLSPLQEECLQRLQNRIEVPYDSQNREHQVLAMSDIEKNIGYPKPHGGYSKPREHRACDLPDRGSDMQMAVASNYKPMEATQQLFDDKNNKFVILSM